MRRALRLTGWVAGSLALAVFFFALWASLRVREAVEEGALARPVWSCLSRPDAERPNALADRAFVRSVQRHLAGDRANSTAWHLNGLVAVTGAQVSFSAEERQRAMRAQLAGLPVCARP